VTMDIYTQLSTDKIESGYRQFEQIRDANIDEASLPNFLPNLTEKI